MTIRLSLIVFFCLLGGCGVESTSTVRVGNESDLPESKSVDDADTNANESIFSVAEYDIKRDPVHDLAATVAQASMVAAITARPTRKTRSTTPKRPRVP